MSVREWWARCALWIRIRLTERRLNSLYKDRDYFLDQIDNGQRGQRYIDRQICLAESDLRHLKRQ